MLVSILQAIAAFPKIFNILERVFGGVYNAIKAAKKRKQKQELREAAEHAKKTKDQRKLEKSLRS